MSDEFLRVAIKEINEELNHISNILKSCMSDGDVSENCEKIEGHFHKIKGLAPMMGKTKVGRIAELIDSLLKNILEGNIIEDIRILLIESNDFMQNDMKDNDSGYEELEQKIQDICSKFSK